jgi:hypothetical protein
MLKWLKWHVTDNIVDNGYSLMGRDAMQYDRCFPKLQMNILPTLSDAACFTETSVRLNKKTPHHNAESSNIQS